MNTVRRVSDQRHARIDIMLGMRESERERSACAHRPDLTQPVSKACLKLLAEGNSVKEIACDLNLSVKTVEAHKFNLMRKLDIHNKAQLVQYAIQKKIIKIPNLA